MKISRKHFLRNTGLGIAGLAVGSNALTQNKMNQNLTQSGNLHLKNVRLETGFEYHDDEVIKTQTELFNITIENGIISDINQHFSKADAIDAKGLLMLPSFKDMHIHLDKTFYGEKWQAVRRRTGGVKGMIKLEQEIMPEILANSTSKAGKLIELLQSHGSGFARSHVNIEPTSKLDSLKNLQKALENKKNGFGSEIVAFPQHGMFYTDTVPYMKEAATMNIDFIGGLDPFSIDGAIEKTMDFTVQLALDFNKGIDIHLHETGESGIKTIEYLIEKVNENPVLKGKTYLSHCFALARLEKNKFEELAEKLSVARIGIVSSIPFGNLVMPIPGLMAKNVEVLVGNDSIVDHWNTFGTGSVLQKANLAAQLYGYSRESQLAGILKLATAGITPLDANGAKIWPNVGDPANVVLIDASCSAEAVARVSPVKSLIINGNQVY